VKPHFLKGFEEDLGAEKLPESKITKSKLQNGRKREEKE